ncbi:MAG: DUF58 domain-containing protein [Desulfurococcales archaeon]|nr:DUF58 domain-containing protein [Desulfurococcales archaeon]
MEEAVTPRLLAYLLAVSLIVGVPLLYTTSVPEALLYSLSIAIAYLGFMKLVAEVGGKVAYRVKVVREYRKPLIEGEEAEIRVEVSNPSWIPVLYVELSDLYPKHFKLVSGSSIVQATLPAKGTFTFTYRVRARLGKHVFRGVEAVVKDPLGLFSYRLIIPGSVEEVQAYPKPYPLPKSSFRRWVTSSLGQTKSGMKGLGNEFMGLREYFPGDDFRFIEWKALARTGKLHVKTFEMESSLHVVFVLDASPAMMFGYLGRTMIEESTRLISGLASYLLRRGDWVGLVVRGRETAIVPVGRGRPHYYRILKAVSQVEWGSWVPKTTLGDAIREAVKAVPKRTKVLFMVFTTLDPLAYRGGSLHAEVRALREVGVKLSTQHHKLVVVSPLPELYELQGLSGMEAGVYLALSVKGIMEVRRYGKELARRGIDVIQVGPTTLLPKLMSYVERFRLVST